MLCRLGLMHLSTCGMILALGDRTLAVLGLTSVILGTILGWLISRRTPPSLSILKRDPCETVGTAPVVRPSASALLSVLGISAGSILLAIGSLELVLKLTSMEYWSSMMPGIIS